MGFIDRLKRFWQNVCCSVEVLDEVDDVVEEVKDVVEVVIEKTIEELKD